MTRYGINRAYLGVASGRHFQVHLTIQHELCERTKLQFSVGRERRVTIEAYAVPDAVGTVLESVADQFKVWLLARMNRDVEVRRTGISQCLGMNARRPASLGSSQVEGHGLRFDAALIGDELRNFERPLLRSYRADDDVG